MIGICIKVAPRSGFALAVELSEWNEIYISNVQMSTLELAAVLSAKQSQLIQQLRTYVHEKHSKDQSLQRYVQSRASKTTASTFLPQSEFRHFSTSYSSASVDLLFLMQQSVLEEVKHQFPLVQPTILSEL